MAKSNAPGTIIIKKIKKAGHGKPHGGAWKVAYADFVTAMMAFFLLLWLLNVTTDVQKRGIADYFDPTLASKSSSGAAGAVCANIRRPAYQLRSAGSPGQSSSQWAARGRHAAGDTDRRAGQEPRQFF